MTCTLEHFGIGDVKVAGRAEVNMESLTGRVEGEVSRQGVTVRLNILKNFQETVLFSQMFVSNTIRVTTKVSFFGGSSCCAP